MAEAAAAEKAARDLAKANNVPYVPPKQAQQAKPTQPPQTQQQRNGGGGGGGIGGGKEVVVGGGGSLLARALSDVSRSGVGTLRKRELGPSPDRVGASSTRLEEEGEQPRSKKARAGGGVQLGLDDLFRVTKVAKPKLYWLPLGEEAVAAKRAKRKELKAEARQRKKEQKADGGGGGGKRGRSYSSHSSDASRSRSRSRSPRVGRRRW